MGCRLLTIEQVYRRYGFFDSEIWHLSHITVYDAITEIFGKEKFKYIDKNDYGYRVRLFHSKHGALTIIFTWRCLDDRGVFSTISAIEYIDFMINEIILEGRFIVLGARTVYIFIKEKKSEFVSITFERG